MKRFDRHIARIAAILAIWVVVSCIIPNIALSVTEDLSLMQRIANILLPLGIYWVIMSIWRKPGWTALCMLPIMVAGAFQIVLLALYGRSPIAVDMLLNVATTNSSEVIELLDALVAILIVVFVIYLPAIVMSVWAILRKAQVSQKFSRRMRFSGVCVLLLGIAAFVLSFYSDRPYEPKSDLFPVNVGYNAYLAVQRTHQLENYHKTSADFKYNAKSVHPDSLREAYIIVIGETSRADNWQIYGYSRPTSPKLMGMKHLIAFPDAMSQSNITHKSVPLMMSPLKAETFGDSLRYIKSIITAFKEAGFHTAFFSNQQRNGSYIDAFGEEADTCIFVKESKGIDPEKCYDTALLPLLHNELQKNRQKQLIVLHTYGSHFNYTDRYPRGYAKFTPDGPLKVSSHMRQQMLNAYDNSILFTAEFIFQVINELDSQHCCSAMFYASDHGEDIFDDQHKLFLHASPIPSLRQLHVPCFLWMSNQYVDRYPHKYYAASTNQKKYVATSDAMFHTVADIAGLSTPYFDKSHSLTRAHYRPPLPMYVNDHNEPVLLTPTLQTH